MVPMHQVLGKFKLLCPVGTSQQSGPVLVYLLSLENVLIGRGQQLQLVNLYVEYLFVHIKLNCEPRTTIRARLYICNV